MKLETVKTFILTILIGISLLLTSVIWNYEPKLDPLQSKYVGEVDIGGSEYTKRSIIRPTSMVFHIGTEAYGFKDAIDQKVVYENMQEWVLSDYSQVNPPDLSNEENVVELSFPISIPLEIASNMFQFKDDVDLPNWLFKRVVITFNESYSNLHAIFWSIDGRHAARFVINDSQAYSYLSAFLNKDYRLTQYIPFGSGQTTPIYIPAEEVTIKRRSLAIEDIDPSFLVNALFKNPSLVSYTIGEGNYNDGQREMTVLNDGRSMEFINPIHSTEHIKFNDLLDLSIGNINDHKGWTNDYILEEIDFSLNRLQYKMHYNGYPVYSHQDYSMIEQQWQSQDLYQYKRPLFRLTNILNSETVTLPSGKEVAEYLYKNSNYNIDNITDIRVGFRLKYEFASYSVVLDPTWYLHYNDMWLELRMSPDELQEKGGL